MEPMIGLIATAGTAVEDRSFTPLRYDQILRGTWDPVARLDDMDTDGVWAQAPFPSFPGFCGNKFVFAEDKELALLCVQGVQRLPPRRVGARQRRTATSR